MSMARVRGPGHPDLACDLVAASIVEEYLKRDPASRLNVRVAGGRGVLFVSGEVLSAADFDVSSVVKRALAQAGYLTQIEPFIAFEQLAPAWAPMVGSREALVTTGYACEGNAGFVPAETWLARQIARELEKKRTQDQEWFWLGSDFEVLVQMGSVSQVTIRVEHVDEVSLVDVRSRVEALVKEIDANLPIQVNLAGQEHGAGLSDRVGSSGRNSSLDALTLSVPVGVSGVGVHGTHTLQAGNWLARAFARKLVQEGKGKAVLVQPSWMPFESRAQSVRVVNDRGEDLSALIPEDFFDLQQVMATWLDPSVVSQVVRFPYDGAVRLPWES